MSAAGWALAGGCSWRAWACKKSFRLRLLKLHFHCVPQEGEAPSISLWDKRCAKSGAQRVQKLKDWRRGGGEARKDERQDRNKRVFTVWMFIAFLLKKCLEYVKNAYKGREGNSLSFFWMDIFTANITLFLLPFDDELASICLRLGTCVWHHLKKHLKGFINMWLWKIQCAESYANISRNCMHPVYASAYKEEDMFLICMPFLLIFKLNLGPYSKFWWLNCFFCLTHIVVISLILQSQNHLLCKRFFRQLIITSSGVVLKTKWMRNNEKNESNNYLK